MRDIFSLSLRSYTASIVGEREEKRGKMHKTFSYATLRLIGEAVPDTGNGEDKTPVVGNRFDLLPQLCHVDVQAVYAFVRARSP